MRRSSGLPAADEAIGALEPHSVVCVAGRPCMGKTALLLDVAVRIHKNYRTNVVIGTAQESPAEIVAMAPPSVRSSMVEIPALGAVSTDCPLPPSCEAKICLVEMPNGDPTCAHFIAHWIRSHHSAGCGLLVANGFTVYSEVGTRAALELEGVRYRVPIERSAARLSARAFAASLKLSRVSGVPTIYGVRSASNNNQVLGPRPADLLHLHQVLRKFGIRTVLIHRPELYLPTGACEEGKGLVELACFDTESTKPRRSRLRYRIGKQAFDTIE